MILYNNIMEGTNCPSYRSIFHSDVSAWSHYPLFSYNCDFQLSYIEIDSVLNTLIAEYSKNYTPQERSLLYYLRMFSYKNIKDCSNIDYFKSKAYPYNLKERLAAVFKQTINNFENVFLKKVLKDHSEFYFSDKHRCSVSKNSNLSYSNILFLRALDNQDAYRNFGLEKYNCLEKQMFLYKNCIFFKDDNGIYPIIMPSIKKGMVAEFSKSIFLENFPKEVDLFIDYDFFNNWKNGIALKRKILEKYYTNFSESEIILFNGKEFSQKYLTTPSFVKKSSISKNKEMYLELTQSVLEKCELSDIKDNKQEIKLFYETLKEINLESSETVEESKESVAVILEENVVVSREQLREFLEAAAEAEHTDEEPIPIVDVGTGPDLRSALFSNASLTELSSIDYPNVLSSSTLTAESMRETIRSVFNDSGLNFVIDNDE